MSIVFIIMVEMLCIYVGSSHKCLWSWLCPCGSSVKSYSMTAVTPVQPEGVLVGAVPWWLGVFKENYNGRKQNILFVLFTWALPLLLEVIVHFQNFLDLLVNEYVKILVHLFPTAERVHFIHFKLQSHTLKKIFIQIVQWVCECATGLI